MPENKIIMGVDPGTRITGYGIIKLENNTHIPIDFGCIRPPVNLPLEKRYLIIFEGIEELIKKFQPSALAVETQFVKKNVQSAIKLGMARGSVILAAAKNNIEVFEYAPRKAKQAIVGSGSASKLQIQKMVQVLLKLTTMPTPEDAADALALAICHSHAILYNKRLEKKPCTNTLKDN
ncbi:MAG: crossover junction endodeoxyribonuclease RuvC [Chlamydiae bacterium]|nr:crossover junction endodeoxyribonuclease RuvC [Chlamydiota bacterium]